MTFNPLDNRRAIVLDITDDQFAEEDELIHLQITDFSSYVTIGQQTAVITIQENDGEQFCVGRDFCQPFISSHVHSFSGDNWIQ